jgi:DeoR family transcriptional regulator, suf operon transcriptional repressor
MGDIQTTVVEGRGNPLPWKGLRSSILVELKRSDRATARQLATGLRVSLNAVRHHLKDLESEALVTYVRSHKGVGAPSFTYRLSPAGEALFPRRYEATVTQLLDHVVQREGRAAAVSMLEGRYQALALRLRDELAGAPPAARLAAVARLLSEEGYMAEAQASGSAGILVEHNCAIQAVAERFPEICAAEARFLADVLGATVDRQGHILNGCSACEYRVRFESADEAAAPPSKESV